MIDCCQERSCWWLASWRRFGGRCEQYGEKRENKKSMLPRDHFFNQCDQKTNFKFGSGWKKKTSTDPQVRARFSSRTWPLILGSGKLRNYRSTRGPSTSTRMGGQARARVRGTVRIGLTKRNEPPPPNFGEFLPDHTKARIDTRNHIIMASKYLESFTRDDDESVFTEFPTSIKGRSS